MQVYANLQPLNVCLTYQGTTNIVKKISQDYDAEVREWAKNLESNMVLKAIWTSKELYCILHGRSAIFATRLSPRAVYFIQTGGNALSNT